MERLIIAITLLLFGANVSALEYHSVNETPENDQLFMWVDIIPGLPRDQRQTIYVSHYREGDHYDKVANGTGWFTFTSEDIEKIFEEGVPLHYIP